MLKVGGFLYLAAATPWEGKLGEAGRGWRFWERQVLFLTLRRRRKYISAELWAVTIRGYCIRERKKNGLAHFVAGGGYFKSDFISVAAVLCCVCVCVFLPSREIAEERLWLRTAYTTITTVVP